MIPAMARKLTRNQSEVLDYLRESRAPMTAYQVLSRMEVERGSVAPQTVYRALKRLEETGLACRIETLRAWAASEAIHPGVVAICDSCGSVRSVEAPDLLDSLHRSLAARGFAEERRTIEVHGRCADCTGDDV